MVGGEKMSKREEERGEKRMNEGALKPPHMTLTRPPLSHGPDSSPAVMREAPLGRLAQPNQSIPRQAGMPARSPQEPLL